jgi:hypothetical protein
MMKLCRDAIRLTAFSLTSIAACLVMSGCAGLGSPSTQPILPDGRLLTQAGFIDMSTQDALIRSYLKSPQSAAQDKMELTSYIEGDGAAWTMRQFAPSNPTPRHALGAQLASQDSSSIVGYLGRPCQFQALQHLSAAMLAYGLRGGLALQQFLWEIRRSMPSYKDLAHTLPINSSRFAL